MTACHDWIAVGPRGVYALLDARLATDDEVAEFESHARFRGHGVELVTVDEACRRHRDFLARGPALAFDLPSFLPSPAQLDFFAGGAA